MDPLHPIRFSEPRSCLVLLLMFLIPYIPCSISYPETKLCKRGFPFKCGNIIADFPFWYENLHPSCDHPLLKLQCNGGTNTTLNVSGILYDVLDIQTESNTLTLARHNRLDPVCPPYPLTNKIFPQVFNISPGYKSVPVFYYCGPPPQYYRFDCPHPGNDSCGPNVNVIVPESFLSEKREGRLEVLNDVLNQGFKVKLNVDMKACEDCWSSNGECAFDSGNQTCCKTDSRGIQKCHHIKSGGLSKGAIAGIVVACGVVAVGLLIACLACFIRRRRKNHSIQYTQTDLPSSAYSSRGTASTTTPTTISRNIHSYSSTKSNLGNGSVYFGVQVFGYEELEEATENFSKELGDGGFGTVYYGKTHQKACYFRRYELGIYGLYDSEGVLRDGRAVAVKRLYETSLRHVEQFKNEIAILKSLKHPNLVILYGCTSRHSRELLLVYEYISNGTLAEHLHGDSAKTHPLPWSVRLDIAIETANAISYLHATGIIHRDVKTTNILLDANFQVKVADFGLSRLFPLEMSHVSTAPQGTPGYVDPEYYQCYSLNEKSDVYSFGVVLAELISSKEPVDITRHRHDINLASMAVARIQNSALEELIDPNLGFDKDIDVRRTMMAVAELAFQCLQQEREVRPSMDEVVEILRRIKEEKTRESPEVVDIDGGRCGRYNVGLLKNDSAPPPLSPETDKWTSSSNSNTTARSF